MQLEQVIQMVEEAQRDWRRVKGVDFEDAPFHGLPAIKDGRLIVSLGDTTQELALDQIKTMRLNGGGGDPVK